MQTDYKKYLPEGELRCGTIPADIVCTGDRLQSRNVHFGTFGDYEDVDESEFLIES